MIITISGMPGSGKTSTADVIAKKLNMKRYSVGNLRREMAKKRGISLQELNKLGESQDFTDKEADEWQRQLTKKDNFVIDGRLSYHFIPKSIKIFLYVKPEISAKRIMLEGREEEKMLSEKQALKMLKERVKSDSKRYKKYYKLNPYDKKQYDFVLDTSDLTIQETVDKILEFINLANKTQIHKT